MDLPTLDFSLFKHGSDAESRKLAKTLVQSFRDHGFVKLINHGLPEDAVKAYMAAAVEFFVLPTESKMKISNARGPNPQRGFSWVGAEQTSKLRKENLIGQTSWDELTDAREHFDAGPPGDTEFPNKWPSEDELPGFQKLIESCYLQFQNICLDLMSAMEVGLDLPNGTLVERCKPASSEMRLNHYPPTNLRELAEGKVKRTWPHTDFGIITLLFQDSIGGLELEQRSQPGTFAPVLPGNPNGPTEMVVNISDTFQRWTNDVIKAGVHQVTVPPTMKGLTEGLCQERYSGIFFFKAHRDTSAGPLPHFVTEKRPAVYDEITALQYQQRMTKVLY
ncbi:Flavonol synthase/flavanone 3-hydroxylase [Tolypocladium ophioglossoides CBS 100239]|uniref:Flavonol synthase/flavanone 3-hydroxylase n=1 Tax=Tolypocladium ophioglossoides (strain CBS 100239) TaxID=1163406 RepID=A0A0L0MYB2_TOLOC|nr:Flavonol synthase/flavanone 3-hydroxylase [Tolypocladium ophioglossoides CBS 100239]